MLNLPEYSGVFPIGRLLKSRLRLLRKFTHFHEGVTSAFNFGYVNGLLVMAATIYFDKVVFVTPMKWKKDLGLTESGLEYKQKKDKARLFAIELFPQAAKDLRLKKHNDRAEALLLTEWYIRKGE